jgi:succinate-semialdehyde dehydrogenase/glutarate-semialdehyde dehydrogenase
LGDFVPDSPAEIEAKLNSVAAAYDSWRRVSFERRADRFQLVARQLRARRADLARMMAQEMGKPLTPAEAEISKCAVTCEHFGQHAKELLQQTPLATSGGRGYARYDPIGPILAIMPWNLPFWQVFRCAVPALMAGNVVALKHAVNVPGCAKAIEEIFREAGFPAGTFVSLRVADDAVVQKLCSHPAIRGVSLTGSEKAGSAVAATAGGALKKTVLELGGSDSFIVLKDSDIEFTATSAAEARCANSGQSCIAAKRFIVEEDIADRFQETFVDAMNKLKMGDPMDHATDMGPLARKDLLDNLQRQVDESVRAGATLVTGGKRADGQGYFYPPTILIDVRPGMPVFDEETFGPVAAVISAEDAGEAVQLANKSRFGLGASIWTKDLDRAEKLAADIEAGNVFINSVVRSDPRLPFGGIKNSGWGRELSEAGIKEFTNVKTVWVSKP